MCLGQLAYCLAVSDDGTALVRVDRVESVISLLTLDAPAAPGDWLLVHSGFALQHLTADEASTAHSIRSTEEVPT